jgi:hypothetical protein
MSTGDSIVARILDYLESNPDIFLALWFGTLFVILAVFFLGGRKAEERFQDLDQQTIRFRERGASGRSHKSLVTKLAGANRVLDVIVTGSELWIKGIWPAFTYIGTKYDLSHRVPLDRVGPARIDGSSVFLKLRDEFGVESDIELRLRNPNDFISAIGASPTL